jgi:hypothetical protein
LGTYHDPLQCLSFLSDIHCGTPLSIYTESSIYNIQRETKKSFFLYLIFILRSMGLILHT